MHVVAVVVKSLSCVWLLQPQGLWHTWLLCPPLSPEVCTNSHPLSQWYYLTISFSATLFFCLQSFPAVGSFPIHQLFTSGGQSIGASASASVLPMSIQGWFPLGLIGLISLLSKELSKESSPVPQFENINSLVLSLIHGPTLTSVQTTRKTIALTIWNSISKVIPLLFNTLSRFVIAFLSRSKHVLISWLQSSSAVILEPKKIKSVTVTFVSPSICHEVMELDAMK